MSKDKLNINIKPLGVLDLLTFKKLVPYRKKKIAEAPANPVKETPPVNVLAHRLHPERQYMTVSEIVEETASARTYRLVPDKDSGTFELAQFRPGQYLSFSFNIEGSTVTRPYSISSSPEDALKGFYEITVKQNEGGYVSNFIFDNWNPGTAVISSGPQGYFYHERLRDASKVIGIAGGCGITPFRSMAKSIAEGTLDISLTLFYGSNTINEIIFLKEFEELERASKGRLKVVHVLSEEKAEGFEYGFITGDLIRKYADINGSSVFICGPQVMYQFLRKEIGNLGLRKKDVRWELFGEIKNVDKVTGYPVEKADGSFTMLVHMGGSTQRIPASAGESVLTAIERAGMNPPSACRSGVCGFCRSLLISGDVFIPEDEDGRRLADKKFGYIHPCSSFPVSDLEIIIPRAR